MAMWCLKWRMPGQEVDQRKLGEIVEKDCQACKLNREDATDCNRWRQQIKDDWDHDRCEWIKVSSGIGSPGLSWTKSREP